MCRRLFLEVAIASRHIMMDNVDLVVMVEMLDMVDNMDMVDYFSMVDIIDMVNMQKALVT